MKTVVKDLHPDQYFKIVGSFTAFYFDVERRITRLNDGTYVDGFFLDKDREVEIVSKDEAREFTIKNRV